MIGAGLPTGRADPTGDVQQARILIDEDEGQRPGGDRTSQLIGTMAQLAARPPDRIRLGGADRDLAAHRVTEPGEIVLFAVADIDQLALDLASRAIRQRHAGEDTLDRGGHPQGRLTALPRAELYRLQVDILQTIGDQLALDELTRRVLTRAACPATADIIAEVEEIQIWLITGPDIADQLALGIA